MGERLRGIVDSVRDALGCVRAILSVPFYHVVELARFLVLNLFPFLALVIGGVFVAALEQPREIFANLVAEGYGVLADDVRQRHHLGVFIAATSLWAALVWYGMRVVSSTRFRADWAPLRTTEDFVRWMSIHLPRLFGLLAMTLVAFAAAAYLPGDARLDATLALALGMTPCAFVFMRFLDRALEGRIPASLPDYRRWIFFIAILAAGTVLWGNRPLPEADTGQWLGRVTRLWADGGAPTWLLLGALLPTLIGLLPGRSAWLFLAFGVWWLGMALHAKPPTGFLVAMLLLGIGIAGFWLAARRRPLFGFRARSAADRQDASRLTLFVLSLATLGLAGLVIAFSGWPVRFGNALGTFGILFLALALWSFVLSFLFVFLPKRWGLPSFAAVPIVWALVLGHPTDHTLRGTSFQPAGVELPRAELWDHLDAWRAQLPDKDQSPIFFVAASGGGLRAAYWTASVLAAMDDATCGEFGRHVFAASGISGGSLGIAAWQAQRRVWRERAADPCRPVRRHEMSAFLARDYLAPLGGSMIFAEAAQLFVPFSYLKTDRGAALADAWADGWDRTFPEAKELLSRPFLRTFATKDAKTLPPALFFNTTAADSGRRAVTTNVLATLPDVYDLDRIAAAGGHERLKVHGLPLKEALLNSARFTYVSPAGSVLGCFGDKGAGDCPPENVTIWGRLVDGGYFENSGIATLLDAMAYLELDEEKKWLANPVFVVLITNDIDAKLACETPPPLYDLRPRARDETAVRGTKRTHEPNPVWPVPGKPLGKLPRASETTVPLEALVSVRGARADFEVTRVRETFACPYVLDWNISPGMAAPQGDRLDPPLGWFVSIETAKRMAQRAGVLAERFPFDLAVCYPGREARGVLGDPKLRAGYCPAPAQTRALPPLTPATK